MEGGLRWRPSRSSSSSDSGKGGGLIAIAIAIGLIAVAWLLSIVIRFALSRRARVPGRRRRGRADQESGRHDHGAAQDRGPRRAARARPRRSWKCASTTPGPGLPTFSPRIPRSTSAWPRWCSSQAATTRAKSSCHPRQARWTRARSRNGIPNRPRRSRRSPSCPASPGRDGRHAAPEPLPGPWGPHGRS